MLAIETLREGKDLALLRQKAQSREMWKKIVDRMGEMATSKYNESENKRLKKKARAQEDGDSSNEDSD